LFGQRVLNNSSSTIADPLQTLESPFKKKNKFEIANSYLLSPGQAIVHRLIKTKSQRPATCIQIKTAINKVEKTKKQKN